jgi:alanine-glyoxylate transaminase/serine-glyoxylate transaminase/serine-pyruvate transaminase
VEEKLVQDRGHRYKAVLVVHNETSTGVTSRLPEIREAIDRARHPALLMVDTVSSLGAIEYRHDQWRVDVTVSGSQKGLMLPPGLGFNAIGPRALEASERAQLPRSYWRWEEMLEHNRAGFFPYTPATNLLFGLKEALSMLKEEGLPQVFARHRRLATAARQAIEAWGLELLSLDPREHSDTVSAVLTPAGVDADWVRRIILERFDMSLGAGLGKLRGKVFRIGHLGHFNDLMLAGTLCGVEMGLRIAGVSIAKSGVEVALDFLSSDPPPGAEPSYEANI